MALIKCPECKKEISDKSQSCIHCGCPIEKELLCNECGKKINKDDKICKNCGCPIETKKERKNPKNIFSKIWLILCIIICLGISIFNFFNNILNIETSSIVIGDLCINVMGILALMLGVSYGILLKSFSKKAFHLVLGINAIILVYNVLFLQMVTHLFYIICVILNSLITFFVVRKKLKSSKFSFKAYIPIFITLIVAIVLTIVLTLLTNGTIDIRSNARNYDIPQIQITTDYINIRDEKSVNSNILGEVYYGEIYDIISEDEESSYNWYEIETSNGIRGFIAGKSEDIEYVKELEVNSVITNEEEKQEETTEEKKEETTTKPNSNNTSNSNSNNNKKPNNSSSNNSSSNSNSNSNSNNNTTSDNNDTSSNNNSNDTSSNNTTTQTPTETKPKQPSISSMTGIGTIYTYKGTSCSLDSFNYSVSRPYTSSPNTIKLDFNFKATMTENSRGWDYCEYDVKIYDSNGTLVHTKPFKMKLGLNEQGYDTNSTIFDSEDNNFSIKVVSG